MKVMMVKSKRVSTLNKMKEIKIITYLRWQVHELSYLIEDEHKNLTLNFS